MDDGVPNGVNTLLSYSKKVAEMIEEYDGFFLVLSHTDADGVSSALQIYKLLSEMDKEFHIKFLKNFDSKKFLEIIEESFDVLLILDLGSGYEDFIEAQLRMRRKRGIIIDHHRTEAVGTYEHLSILNPWNFGISGDFEACTSSLAFSVLLSYNESFVSLAPFAFAGILGDKQLQNPVGLNKYLLDLAISRGGLKTRRGIILKRASVAESLAYSLPPYISNVTGDVDGAKAFLKSINLDPELLTEEVLMNEEIAKKLSSAIALKLSEQCIDEEDIKGVLGPHYYTEVENYTIYVDDLTEILDAMGRSGNTGLLPRLAEYDLRTIFQLTNFAESIKKDAIKALRDLESSYKDMGTYWFYMCNDPRIRSLVATFGVSYVVPKDKPLIVMTLEEGSYVISARAHKSLAEKGLDLSWSLKNVAEKFGGHGGGHRVAAGARIPGEHDLEEILRALKEALKIV